MTTETTIHREPPARTRVAVGLGRAVSYLSRRAGRGSGSVIGGRAILAVDPDALKALSAGRKCALVSGTNGKTTTTRLLSSGLATLEPVVTNVLGANLPAGVVASLAAGAPGLPAVLEVDEAWLGKIAADVHPEVVVLLNLSRDQLDRNNEVRNIASRWREVLGGLKDVKIIANADDPLIAWAASSAEQVIWVGAGQPWTHDASGCPSCGARIEFEREGWACSGCELSRPTIQVWVEPASSNVPARIVYASGEHHDLHLTLPGRCNQANAAMALEAASALGAEKESVLEAFSKATEVVGRYRTVSVEGVDARMLLSKNPAGWLEVLDVLSPAPTPVVVAINARIADGRDPSWLWDVPFESLRGRLVVATGERNRDLAVRLKYADVNYVRIPDPLAAIARAGEAMREAEIDGSVDVVANYTSFHQILSRLGVPLADAEPRTGSRLK